eukprot:scaffold368_cov258-Pinguiococcus_pyrenoidosus.AAC.59
MDQVKSHAERFYLPLQVLCIARLIFLAVPLYVSTPIFATAVYWAHSKLSGDVGKDGRAHDSGPNQTEEALLAEIAADEEKERLAEQRRKSRQDSKRKAKAARRAVANNEDDGDEDDEDDSSLANLVSTGKK